MILAEPAHRVDLLNKLARYRPIDRADAARVLEIEDFVMKHSDCLERSLLEGHVTGSAWLVDAAGERVLLTHHKKLGLWLQLGGHADGNPDLLDVALREAREESGLADIVPVSENIFDVDVHEIPERPGEPAHVHYDVRFALRVTGSTQFTVSGESHALAWVPIDRLEERTSQPEMLRMRDKWISLRRKASERL